MLEISDLVSRGRHSIISGLESWSGVLEWSGVKIGVDFGVKFGVEVGFFF